MTGTPLRIPSARHRKTADAIAMKLGVEKTAMVRVRAGISDALTEAMDDGHCGLPTEELVPLAVESQRAEGEQLLDMLRLLQDERSHVAERDKPGAVLEHDQAGEFRRPSPGGSSLHWPREGGGQCTRFLDGLKMKNPVCAAIWLAI